MRRVGACLIATLAVALLGAAAAAQGPQPRRAYVGEARCPVDLPDDFPRTFTQTEQDVWKRVCLGQFVSLYGRSDENRTLGADFLALILTRAPWKTVLAKPEITIAGANITGQLDLEDLDVDAAFTLLRSDLPDGMLLRKARFARSIAFTGSRFGYRIEASEIRVDGDLVLSHTSVSSGVHLDGADISGNVFAVETTIAGVFSASGARIGDDLRLSSGGLLGREARLGGVVLTDAEIGGSLSARGTTVESIFLAGRLKVGGSFFLDRRATLAELNLLGAEIGGQIVASSATFSGVLDADGVKVGASVFLNDEATFEAVYLSGAEIGGQIVASSSTFSDVLKAQRMKVGLSVFLNDGATFEAVYLIGAKIGGSLHASGSSFGGPFTADSLHVGSELSLSDSEFFDEVGLLGAEIGGQVIADGSSFGEFNADGMRVGDDLYMLDSAFFRGIDLLGANIGGQFSANQSSFGGQFNADGLRVSADLFLNDDAGFGDIDLIGADIGGTVSAIGSTVNGLFNAGSMRVGGGLLLRGGTSFGAVRLLGAEIRGNVEADGSTFKGEFSADGMRVGGGLFLRGGATFDAMDLPRVEIGRVLQFGASNFDGVIDMTGTRINGELLLSSLFHGTPIWGKDARLVLRNVTADALQAEEHAWERPDGSMLPTDLTGFAYGRFGGLHADEGTSMADSTDDWLVRWIEAQPDHDARYDPQPYEQLAAALDAAGENAKARAIRVAKFEHRARTPGVSGWERLRLWFSRWLIGHGEYPFNTLAWFGGLVGAGYLVAMYSRAEVLRDAPGRNGFAVMAGWFWYSLENSLPLVQLKPAHAEAEHGSAWIEGFFHLQKIFGFVLATILVGALTVLGG